MGLTPRRRVWCLGAFVSLTAATYGGDSGSIAAITTMPAFSAHFGPLSEFMRGVVVALIFLPSAVMGLFCGPISDRFSRKYTISAGASVAAVGSTLSCAAPNIATLLLARCIAGVGQGLYMSASVTYLVEISTARILVSCYSLFITGSIAAGFFVTLATSKIQSSLSWRLPFAIATTVSLVSAIGAPFLPFSPRWLCSVGRRDEAERVLDVLVGPEDADERAQLLAVPVTDPTRSWRDIFAKGVRGRTVLGIFLNNEKVYYQLSGIDFVVIFAPILFNQAGLDPETTSFIASGLTGLVLFSVSAVGPLYVNRVGRRPLILGGGLFVSLCLLSIGSLYASGEARTTTGKWTVIALIELYTIFFTATQILCLRLYATEIQPPHTRATASSWGQGINQLLNTAVAMTSPAFLAKSPSAPYLFYGGLTAVGTAVLFLIMPETKDKSLESIDTMFQSRGSLVAWPPTFQRAKGLQTTLRRRARGVDSLHQEVDVELSER